jgi:pimeloyl-ACP methyl ester carboxylesterase
LPVPPPGETELRREVDRAAHLVLIRASSRVSLVLREHGPVEVRRGDGSAIALEVAGDRGATPVLVCHGLADSRLSALWFRPAAEQLGLYVIVPDRPGIGRTDRRRLGQLGDWAEDATLILDALRVDSAVLLGVSGGGPFAAACAARIPDRVRSLMLIAPLGSPEWPTSGMAPGERLSLALARHSPAFGGWGLDRLAALARIRPELFLRLAATAQPEADIRALQQPGMRESFLTSYLEAFRRGSWGVTQDLRLLSQPWDFHLGSITAPTWVRHGDADTTVPVQHARRYAEAIGGADLRIYPGHGHFSILSHPQDVLATLAS